MRLQVESLIFDMDGTLWDSSENVARSWTEVLERQADIDRVVTQADIQAVMGLPMDAIAARLFPEVSRERQAELIDLCGRYENAYLATHGGVLYESLEETLAALAQTHRLFIVSNCQSGYIEAFLRHYEFDRYFRGTLCWGDTHAMKGESIRILMERYSITDAAYIGDIQGDCDSARYAGIRFIHAAYGFGEVENPDAVITSFPQLLAVVE